MEIVDRLVAFRDHTGLTNSQFADQAFIPRPTLSQFLNGRNKRLSDEFVAKLHTAYPDLNVLWLLFGEGDMLNDTNIETSEGSQPRKSVDSATQTDVNKPIGSILDSETSSEEKEVIYKAGDTSAESIHNFSAAELNSASAPVIPVDPHKTIRSIMVFYSDNSYESFVPAKQQKE